jgi:hypothetical protein
MAILLVVASFVLAQVAGQRRDSAVEGFARAPVGCDTTLDFVDSGTYTVYLERVGRVDGARGNCEVDGSYNVGPDPDVSVQIVDPDGNELDLDRSSGDVSYDAAGFEGESIFTVEIEETNDHTIRVESSDDETFAVAVGRDPADGVAALQVGALASAVVGVLGGLIVLVSALRRRRSTATTTGGAWNPGAPGQAPVYYGQPGQVPQGPPVYGQPGQTSPPQYPPQQQYPQQYPPQQQYPAQQYQPQYPPQPPQVGVPPNYGQQPSWSTPPPPPPTSAQPPVDWSQASSETVVPDADYYARLQAEQNRQQPPPPS